MQAARCPAHPDATLRPQAVTAEDRFWGVPGEFTYGVCPDCGTWVLDPRPEPADLGPYYAHYYSEKELEDRRAAFKKHRPEVALGVDRLRALDAVARLKKSGATLDAETRLLDTGCGAGGFARAFRDLTGAQARGLDFNPRCAEFCAEVHQLEVDTGELAAQAYAAASFDVVSSWHCLEHVYDPQAELNELARITRSGGFLVMEVPTPSPWARLFRGRWFFLQAPTHLYHLRPSALRQLVEAAGWEPVQFLRPWLPSEWAGSVLMALGMRGFAPRLLFKKKGASEWAWSLLFGLLLTIDIPLTFVQAVLGHAGVLRVVARRSETPA
jgi:ubiquinone/menaquinone biosynthesis C-methylase UbiE